MDEQKQIEEIAKDINNTWCLKPNGDIFAINEKLNKNDIEMLAHQLVLEGYRKLPEDSVVLSKEKYGMLVNQYKNLEIKYSNLSDNYRLCKDANETLKQNIIITRNETVEKILRDLYSEATSNVSETVELTTFQIEQLAKQFVVEIKE